MSAAEPIKTPSTSAPSNRGPLTVLFATVFVDLLGFGIVIPFLPIYVERLGVGAFAIGLILSSYSLMQFLVAPILGRISDHVGRRPVIMLGLLGSSLSYFVYGFAYSLPMLLISRAIHGACAATVSTAQAYVADITPEEKRAHGMGMIGAAFGLGFVLGPAIGGLLGRSGLRVPVFFASALTLANLVFAAVALPESHRPSGEHRLRLGLFAQPVRLPVELVRHHMARIFLVGFLATFAMVLFEATFALMAPVVYGLSTAGIGGMLAYAGLVQAITQGYLLRKIVGRVGEYRLIRLGLLLFAIAMAPMANFGSQGLLFVLLAALAIGYGFTNPSIASLISKLTGRHLQGELLGLNQSALALARIFGPLVAGLLYDVGGPTVVYVSGGIAAVAGLLLAGPINQIKGEVPR